MLGEILSTRGSHYGERPLAPAAEAPGNGRLAVVTLGRTTLCSVPRFLWHGRGLARHILGADGMVSAISAGSPLTGNLTFSLWDSQEAMVAFAYGGAVPGGHVETVRARPPILVEQLSARIRPLTALGAP